MATTYTMPTIPGLRCATCGAAITTDTMVYEPADPHGGDRRFFHPACTEAASTTWTPPTPIGRSREGYPEYDPRALYDARAHEED